MSMIHCYIKQFSNNLNILLTPPLVQPPLRRNQGSLLAFSCHVSLVSVDLNHLSTPLHCLKWSPCVQAWLAWDTVFWSQLPNYIAVPSLKSERHAWNSYSLHQTPTPSLACSSCLALFCACGAVSTQISNSFQVGEKQSHLPQITELEDFKDDILQVLLL